EWVHVQLHQQKGMISLSPPTICNSAVNGPELFLSPACARLLAIFLLRTGFMLIFEQYLRLKCYKL
ncbi:hypothetical protein, partial [Enterobacter hormaechei]|uniref:hypothetical protein n=1 Tax=Enterobacter hormaechei TaxID=158836 RepID=UPI003BDA38BA